MKKTFSVLYKLLIISILMQTLVYFFIENFYVGDRSDLKNKISITPISTSGFDQNNKGVNVKGIPDSASNIKVSFDTSYVSYIENGKVLVIDSSTGKTAATLENVFPTSAGKVNSDGQKAHIDWYSWYLDRNTILYALSAPESSSGRVQIMTYDVTTGNTQIGSSITDIARGSRVTDVAFSSLNMTAYMNVKTSSSQARGYIINIMNNILSSFSLPLNAVLKSGYYTDNLLYQNSKNQIFIKKAVNSARQISLKKKSSLISVVGDSSNGKDIAYIGELNESGKVGSIIYGDITTNPSEWTSLPLKSPCSSSDIVVKGNKVYQIVQNTLYNVTDNKEVRYEGKFIDIVEDQVIYIDNGTIKSKSL